MPEEAAGVFIRNSGSGLSPILLVLLKNRRVQKIRFGLFLRDKAFSMHSFKASLRRTIPWERFIETTLLDLRGLAVADQMADRRS